VTKLCFRVYLSSTQYGLSEQIIKGVRNLKLVPSLIIQRKLLG